MRALFTLLPGRWILRRRYTGPCINVLLGPSGGQDSHSRRLSGNHKISGRRINIRSRGDRTKPGPLARSELLALWHPISR
jgi:hypothetical protein